jgi:hypothetical protein
VVFVDVTVFVQDFKLAMMEADGRCVDNLQPGPLPCDVYPSGKVKLEGGSELLDTPNSLVTMPTS